MGRGGQRDARRDGRLGELNKLDDELLAEMENGDGPGSRATPSSALLGAKVRELGEPLPDRRAWSLPDLILRPGPPTLEESPGTPEATTA
ncbi:hypothetical protein SVIOM342S_01423 [Streptomyces violaceorubidus]